MAQEDQEMVARFLRGETEAVVTVDSWISRAAWPYQRRLSERFEDVLQEVRLEITRLLGQGKFRGESSLRTYLWRVVNHTCLDHIRSERRWQWADLEELEAPGVRTPFPQVAAAPAEERDLLLRVLDRATQDCRDLWRMIVAGLSYREMSQRMDVAEGTLRVRVLRCREKAVAMRAQLLDGKLPPDRNVRRGGSPNLS